MVRVTGLILSAEGNTRGSLLHNSAHSSVHKSEALKTTAGELLQMPVLLSVEWVGDFIQDQTRIVNFRHKFRNT